MVSGLIVDGDAARFNQIAMRWPDKSVAVGLAGPGGKLAEGLKIGNTIRTHGYATIVTDECASACSLVWLAGTTRLALDGGSLGFHAAYVKVGADIRESVQANAIVGAYLANLGLSYDVVEYVTAAAPTGITWLTAAEAKQLGIKYTFIPNKPSSAPPPRAAATVETAPRQAADVAKRAELNERFSTSERLLRQELGDKPVDALIARFKAAAQEDPSLWSRLAAQSDPLRWAFTEMPALQRQIASSRTDTAEAAVTLTPSYAQGRQARIDYERWFAGLPAGKYLQGATFWASNRSLKPRPTCTSPAQPEWQNGCVDSRARLAPADRRRLTEPSFWWGWNSV